VLPALQRNSRVLGTGPTGSGKSYLFRALLKAQRHAIIVDSKHGFEWNDSDPRFSRVVYSVADLVRALRDVERVGDGAPVIYRPRRITFEDFEAGSASFLAQRRSDLNYLWWLALERGNTLVYHDEISLDVPGASFEAVAPMWRELVITGRFRGCGMWAGSQRPARIPLIASTEASDRFTFFLRSPTDQQVVDHYFGGGVPWATLAANEHSFVWASDATMNTSASLLPMRLGAREDLIHADHSSAGRL
jgi:energy-coupling factor transporter ATP-binding protein EcfA2